MLHRRLRCAFGINKATKEGVTFADPIASCAVEFPVWRKRP